MNVGGAGGRGQGSRGRKSDLARGQGRLILVTCADMARLDVVLHAAIRRLASRPGITVAEPVVTRTLPAGSGMVVSKRSFAAYEAGGAFCLSWRSGGRVHGYLASLLDCIAGGGVVIAGAGREAEAGSLGLPCPVRIVRLVAGTESLRAALAGSGREPADDRVVRVIDRGEASAVVMALTSVIDAQLPPNGRALQPVLDLAAVARDEGPGLDWQPAQPTQRRSSGGLSQSVGRMARPQARSLSPT